jgi:hypothetical protein
MSEIIKYHLQPVSVNSEEIIFSLSTLKKFSLNPSLKRREAKKEGGSTSFLIKTRENIDRKMTI